MRLSATTHPSRRPTRALAPVSLLGLVLLSGCGAAAGGAEAPAPEKTAKAGTTSEPSDPAEAGPVAGECMVGQWDVDPEVVREAALGGLGALGADAQIETTGTTWVTFDGSIMSNVYEDQLTTITMPVEGQTVAMTIVIDGTVTAPYSVTEAEAEVVVEPTDASALTTTITATVDGVPIEVPSTDEAMKQAADFSGSHTYTCDDETLHLVRTDGLAAGMAQVFTRRG